MPAVAAVGCARGGYGMAAGNMGALAGPEEHTFRQVATLDCRYGKGWYNELNCEYRFWARKS